MDARDDIAAPGPDAGRDGSGAGDDAAADVRAAPDDGADVPGVQRDANTDATMAPDAQDAAWSDLGGAPDADAPTGDGTDGSSADAAGGLDVPGTPGCGIDASPAMPDGGADGASIRDGAPDAARTVVAVTVTAPLDHLRSSWPTMQLHAFASYSDGAVEEVTDRATWTSSTPSVITVSPTGLATEVSIGSSVINATFDGVSGAVAVDAFTGGIPRDLEWSNPGPVVIWPGRVVSLRAILRLSIPPLVDVTDAPSVTFSSSAPDVATISSGPGTPGVVTGVAVGTATLTASLMFPSAPTPWTATVTVNVVSPASSLVDVQSAGGVRVGQSTRLSAMYYGTAGEVEIRDDLSTVWHSSDPSIAFIGNGPGLGGVVTGLRPGVVTVTCSAAPFIRLPIVVTGP
jgi:hypothetical protein